jgi:glycosyltransferase involved in cell wall biosynthesis
MKQKNIILHFCNVWWRGGVCLFILDIMKAFPDFKHVIVSRISTNHDEELMKELYSLGGELFFYNKVDLELLKSIDPLVSILHNIAPNNIKDIKELDQLPIITWCHGLPIRWNVENLYNIFVSKYIYKYSVETYLNNKPIKTIDFIPPCIDTSLYKRKRLKNKVQGDIVRFGTCFSPWMKNKYPEKYLEIIREAAKKNPFAELIELTKPTKNFENFLGQIDCLISFTENTMPWERVITEAFASGASVITNDTGGPKEQLVAAGKHSGVMISSINQIEEAIKEITDQPELYIPNTQGQKWACSNASLEYLSAKLLPIIIKVGLGGG